jgi:predicted dehydrogenase
LKSASSGATAVAARATVEPSAHRDDTAIRAVAASDPDRAAKFALLHGIPVVHRDYAALIEDQSINVVYVSLLQLCASRVGDAGGARG